MLSWLRYVSIPSTYILILLYSISDGAFAKLSIAGVFAGTLLLLSLQVLTDREFIGKCKHNLPNFQYLWAFLLLCTLFVVSVFRQVVIEDPLPTLFRLLLLLYTLAVSIYYLGTSGSDRRYINFIVSVSWMLFLPVILNVFLYAIGVTGDSLVRQPALMLETVGIHIDRVRFFLSYGINSYAPIASLSFLASYFLLVDSQGVVRKLVYSAICLISVASILMVDSRGSFFICIFLVLAFSLLRVSRVAIAGSILFAPLVFAFLLSLDLSVMSMFSRGQADAGSLSGRLLFWLVVLDYVGSFDPTHLFGNRLFFQPYSFGAFSVDNDFGMSHVYFTLHNSVLQMLMQIGYLGLIVFYVLLTQLARITSGTTPRLIDGNGRMLALAMVLYILLIGNIETVFTPSVFIFPAVVFVFMSAAHRSMALTSKNLSDIRQ